MTNKLKSFKLFTDGACWGNPGETAVGMVIFDRENNEIFKGAVYLGEATNNIAEYSAVMEGLVVANDLNITEIEVYSDSQLIIKQLKNEYKVKSDNLKKLRDKIFKIKEKFSRVDFFYSSRDKIDVAHKLAESLLKSKTDTADRSLSTL